MNVLTLTGRLGSDPVRRDTTNGVVCEFRLAVDGRPRIWITVETWGHLAGTCAQHLHDGRRVAISGTLLGHNPFIQPGVNAYKDAIFALAGKPGHEKAATALRQELSGRKRMRIA